MKERGGAEVERPLCQNLENYFHMEALRLLNSVPLNKSLKSSEHPFPYIVISAMALAL